MGTARCSVEDQFEFERLLDEWIGWMHAGAMSQRTVSARRQLLIRLAVCCDPVSATWKDLGRFLAVPNLSRGTRMTYRNILQQWFKWLQAMDYRLDDPTRKLPPVRTPRRVPRPITTSALSRLLDSGTYSRTRTMIMLAAYQGLRVHEIAKIRGEDFREGFLWVTGKGGVTAKLPIHPCIEDERCRYPRTGWWFTSPDDRTRPVLPRSVSSTLSLAMHRAGIPASAHQLRHWFGTEALRGAGGNVRVAQELLRHANIATTAGYTQVDDTERIAAINALPETWATSST